jgi:hypothetical protein
MAVLTKGAHMNEWFIFFVIASCVFVAACVYYTATELHQVRKLMEQLNETAKKMARLG